MSEIQREARKSFMLAATLEESGVGVPVRIRNMSTRGALIDGDYLPGPGSTVELARLALRVTGTVVWRQNGRCGLKLGADVRPDEWVAGVRKGAVAAHLGQTRVDEIQAALRQGAAKPAPPAAEPAARAIDRDKLDARIASEIAAATRTLDAALDELSQNPDILARHQQALQSIDIACAILALLPPVLRAADRDKAVQAVEMHEVRSRLSGVPTLT